MESLVLFHPAVMWLTAEVRRAREYCCDDIAVQSSGDALAYARGLTALARLPGLGTRAALYANGGDLKARQREMWASFAPTAAFTTPVAAHLVEFAEVKPGETLLDVGTGTGVVAITAARAGASVTGLDLTPVLLEVARENARVARLATTQWFEGDVESLQIGRAHV